jgi:beta-aspartyl-peptidase (threonine type)
MIHGGAGNYRLADMSPEEQTQRRAAMTRALEAGHAILARGGSSVDAVQAAVNVLEDSPLFNAGKGAVFTHDGKNELDAAIMDGKTLGAGAVAGLHHIKNPIDLARLVMEKSPHVMMAGDGAEAFAKTQGMKLVPAKYFHTERAWKSLQRAKEEERRAAPTTSRRAGGAVGDSPWPNAYKFGTVGAVALDQSGNLAAGTSTGGMTNKRYGRIGDVPIIGAGTYANNASCAVSATGHGEYFIRYTVAHDICARVQYKGMSLADAADSVVMGELVRAKGEGGVITMDAAGNMAMPFNSAGMFRGYVTADGKVTVLLGDATESR